MLDCGPITSRIAKAFRDRSLKVKKKSANLKD